MKKNNQPRRMVAMALAACVATSAMPVTAFADTVTNADGSTTETSTTTNADGSTTTNSTTTSADGNTVSNTTATDDGNGNTSSATTTTINNGSSTVVDVNIQEGWNNTVDNNAGDGTEGNPADTPAEGGSDTDDSEKTDLEKFLEEHLPGTTQSDVTNTTGSETTTTHTETKNNENKDPLKNSGSTTGSETVTQTQTTVEKTTETVFEFDKDWELTDSNADPEADKEVNYTDDTDYTTDSSTGPTDFTPSVEGGNAYIDATDGDLTVTLDGSQAQIKKDAKGNPVYDANGNPVYEVIKNTTTTDDATTEAAYAALVSTVKNGLTQKLATELGVSGTASGENVTFEKTELVNVGTAAEGETQKQNKVVTKVTLQPVKDPATGEVTGFETVKEVYTIPYNYYTTETEGDIVENTAQQTTTVENGTLLKDAQGNPILDAETGRPIMLVPVLDAEGNPVLDTDGKPVLQEQIAPTTVSVTGGTPVVKLPELNLPDVGETVDGVTGDKTTVTVDPVTGDKTYVTEEAATGYKKVMTVEPKYAEDGVTQIGWIKNTVIYNGEKEIGGGQETILGTVTYTETKKQVEQATTIDKYGTQLVETTKQIDKVVTTETINITATERQMWAEMLMRLGEGHGDTTLQQFIKPDEATYSNYDLADLRDADLRPGDYQWQDLTKDVHAGEDIPDGKLKFTGYGMWSELLVHEMNAQYDANGNIIDYVDGGWQSSHNAHLFELTDSNDQTFYGYCAELGKNISSGAYYNIENINDADWYTFDNPDAKENIMAIAVNGYWGTSSGVGSLEAVQDSLKKAKAAAEKAGQTFAMTDAQIDNLTEGQAMAATQAAIWKYGNGNNGAIKINDEQIIGSYWGDDNGIYKYTIFDDYSDAQADREAAQAMFNYLVNIVSENGTYTPPAGFEETNVLDVEDVTASITAKEKVGEGATDADDDDVYNADVSFTLAITPDDSKGDNYNVYVFDQNGNKLKEVNLKDFGKDVAGAEGTSVNDRTYTINMQLAENVNVTLNIGGFQNLNNSVYLYTSEPITKEDGTVDHSQTFVGLAGGQRKVNLNMDLQFSVDEPTVTATGSRSSSNSHKTVNGSYTNNYHAQEGNVVALVEVTKETVTTTSREWNEEYEETWSYGGNGGGTTPGGGGTTPGGGDPGMMIPDEDVPLTETPEEDGMVLGAEDEEDPMVLGAEEEAPLIAATGDSNHMAAGFGGMLAALAGMFMLRRKKEQ